MVQRNCVGVNQDDDEREYDFRENAEDTAFAEWCEEEALRRVYPELNQREAA